MRTIFLLVCVLIASVSLQAQTYERAIDAHRQQYKREFLEDTHSPLTAKDTGGLRFYAAHPGYVVTAHFTPIVDTVGFDMHTHSGVTKRYFVYGSVEFTLMKQVCTLFVYQSKSLREKPGFEDYLFIPFTDETNYTETFGGGRYLDFRTKDIFDKKMTIDFNKAYNPYCAYKGGYTCPIPPKENDLKISIQAGEKLFDDLHAKRRSK
ncbi:MAG TPA: DUF1684 domain-containing protein [Chitinophagaceae bacterium]|nr:DUF1684 domain-containing protein [Chitinophagaceae bacterium]